MSDVAFATLEPVDLRRIDIEAQDREAACREGPGQGQADIAQADDADARRLSQYLSQKKRVLIGDFFKLIRMSRRQGDRRFSFLFKDGWFELHVDPQILSSVFRSSGKRSTMILAILSPALPSQSGGTFP